MVPCNPRGISKLAKELGWLVSPVGYLHGLLHGMEGKKNIQRREGGRLGRNSMGGTRASTHLIHY